MSAYINTETLSVNEAARLMGKNPMFVRIGLQNKRFGFGYAVRGNGRWNYYINRRKFLEETGIKEVQDGGDHDSTPKD